MSTTVQEVRLSLPQVYGGIPPETWIIAFRSCAESTRKSISHPVGTKDVLLAPPNAAHERTAPDLTTLQSNGYTLPKSPSLQAQAILHEGPMSNKQTEREERRWWSLRFQQVLQEAQE